MDTLKWSPVRTLHNLTSACENMCMCEWQVLKGGHLCQPPLCHQLVNKWDWDRAGGKTGVYWTKDITAAGDVNEKWHCGSISVSSVRRHMKRKQCLNLLWRMQLENMWSNSLNLCASNALNRNLHPTSIFMYSYCLSKHYNSVEIYYCATNCVYHSCLILEAFMRITEMHFIQIKKYWMWLSLLSMFAF